MLFLGCHYELNNAIKMSLVDSIANSISKNNPKGEGLDLSGLGTFGIADSTDGRTVLFESVGTKNEDTKFFAANFVDDWAGETAYLKVDDHYVSYRGFQEFNGQEEFVGCKHVIYKRFHFV
eukprot:m.57009 g.57009  ORF g.57009 m.57009 type:complete len:121 (-) comp11075_c0_seq1:455-817(-)